MSLTMPIFECPLCSNRFRYHFFQRGRRVKCPYCTSPMRMPISTECAAMESVHGIKPVEWQAECEELVASISRLLYAADRRWAASAVIELLRSLPRTPDEIKINSDTLFGRLCCEAIDTHAAELRKVAEFVKQFATISSIRREMLEASVIGTLLGWGMAK
jgi:hypothetical protein